MNQIYYIIILSCLDNWTRPQIASISNDQPPAYANVNAGIMEHAPSAPLAAFVDVSGVIVDVDGMK